MAGHPDKQVWARRWLATLTSRCGQRAAKLSGWHWLPGQASADTARRHPTTNTCNQSEPSSPEVQSSSLIKQSIEYKQAPIMAGCIVLPTNRRSWLYENLPKKGV